MIDIEEVDLDPELKTILRSHGITSLFPPQAEALEIGLLNSSANQVISTSTATGKTLLAELVMINSILKKNGKCIYITPLKAIAEEKYESFTIKYQNLPKPNGQKVNIGVFTGDYSTGFYDKKIDGNTFDIMVMTPEKLDSVTRMHKSNTWIQEISILVIDEFHLLGDEGRGPRLEACIVRMRELNPSLRIIALSATISNIDDIADWLKATYYTSTWRPVKLETRVVIAKENKDDAIAREVLATIGEGGQCLVFVNARKKAETAALKLSNKVWSLITTEDREELTKRAQKINGPSTVEKVLSTFIPKGVAFHHAGLNREQRAVVEMAFKNNILRCICCTPTLAMGVNLPARKVIISDLTKPSNGKAEPLSIMEVQQIAGRAGRPGFDSEGYCVIIGSRGNNEQYLIDRYLNGAVEPVESKLLEPKRILEQILAEFVSGLSTTENDLIYSFFAKSFAAHKNPIDTIKVYNGIDILVNNELLKKDDRDRYFPTFLGRMTSQLYVGPESSIIMRQFLLAIEKFEIMDLLFMLCSLPDLEPKIWIRGDEVDDLIDRAQSLDFKLKNYSFDAIANTILADPAKPEMNVLESIKRSLIIYDWISGKDDSEIYEKYRIYPDDLHKLKDNAEWMAHALASIANAVRVNDNPREDVKELAKELVLRIHYGASPELLELVRIPEIGRKRALQLHSEGIKGCDDIAKTSIEALMRKGGFGRSIAIRVKNYISESSIERSEMSLKWFISFEEKIELIKVISTNLDASFKYNDLVDLCQKEGLDDPNYYIEKLMENGELVTLPDGRLQWRG